MGSMNERLESLIGKKVLIEGDIGTGKTTYTYELLEQALATRNLKRIIVIDMAPSRRQDRSKFVGGAMRLPQDYERKVRYFAPSHVFAPRLEGKDRVQVLEYALRNSEEIGKLLLANLRRKNEILFINDMTMFFHAGDINLLLRLIKNTHTFIANAYKGTYLAEDKGSGITLRERTLLETIEKSMDLIIQL